VTDSVGVIAISPASNVTVNTQLTVTISPNVAAIYWGQSQIFNSSVSGGTSPYSYQWYRNGTLVSGATNSTWTFTPSAAGYHTIYVKVTDNASTPFTVQSGNAQLTVNPSPAWPMFRNDSTHIGYSTSTAPTTNKTLWSNQTKGWVRSSPAVAGGVVYVGSYDKKVYALNATTGTPVWNYTTGGAVESSPAVAGGVVFVGSDNGYVYALNATTGAPMWNYTTPTHGVVDSSPAVAGGVVFVGTNNGYVYALNATTGAPVWSRKICPSIVHSSPAVAGGFVFVGSTDSNVYALDAATGTVRWKYLTGAAVYSSPAVVGGVVYVGSADYYVYALLNAANSASVEWKYKTKNVVYSSPAVAGGVVFVGSWDNKTYALNASSGALIWSYTTGDAVESSPAVADGVVYVGSADGKVYALDAATGTLVWSYTTDGVVVSSPAVAGGVVYVGSDDYNVYAIGLSPSPDVAVTGVMSSKTVGQGFSTSISVTVANQDNRAETFKVTAYANAIPIASQNVTLSSGTSATITFAWNTSGFAKGNCTISAYATPVTDETDIINNNCTDCSVLITKVGDLGSRVLVSPGPPPVYANEFFVCDGAVTSTDLNLFLQCYKATAPTDAMYLGDLGSRVVVGGSYANVFFVRDGKVTSTDLNLFLQCYKGQGPPDP
jgi:outer membrane protein assembly factor BamB